MGMCSSTSVPLETNGSIPQNLSWSVIPVIANYEKEDSELEENKEKDGDCSTMFNDKAVLEKAFRKYHDDNYLFVKEFSVSEAVGKGENYMSAISRVTCTIVRGEGRSYTKKIIVKSAPPGFVVEELEIPLIFKREITMYGEVMPAITKILGSLPLSPEQYFAEIEPNPIIIMEDLCEIGFQVGDRHGGLSLEQGIQVVKALAAYHVGSMVFLKERDDLVEFFTFGFWGKENPAFILQGYNFVMNNIDSWNNVSWSHELASKSETIVDEMSSACEAHDPPMVLNHSDLWTNNIMFRSNESDGLDLRFIDLQLCSIRSPVFDLMYFIFTSLQNEIRVSEIDTLLTAYHDQWCLICDELGEDTDFTLGDLKDKFRKNLVFGLGHVVSVLPVMTAPSDMAQEVFKNGVSEKLFEHAFVKEAILKSMAYFKENGLFNELPPVGDGNVG